MTKQLKTFICTRYYAVVARTLEEAKEEMRNHENDIDYLNHEQWEEEKEN